MIMYLSFFFRRCHYIMHPVQSSSSQYWLFVCKLVRQIGLLPALCFRSPSNCFCLRCSRHARRSRGMVSESKNWWVDVGGRDWIRSLISLHFTSSVKRRWKGQWGTKLDILNSLHKKELNERLRTDAWDVLIHSIIYHSVHCQTFKQVLQTDFLIVSWGLWPGCGEVVAQVSYVPGVKHWCQFNSFLHTSNAVPSAVSLSREKYQILLTLKWYMRGQHNTVIFQNATYIISIHIPKYHKIRANIIATRLQTLVSSTLVKHCKSPVDAALFNIIIWHISASGAWNAVIMFHYISPTWNNLDKSARIQGGHKLAYGVVHDWSHHSDQLKWSWSPQLRISDKWQVYISTLPRPLTNSGL